MLRKKTRVSAVLFAAAFALSSAGVGASAQERPGKLKFIDNSKTTGNAECPDDCQEELSAARAATAKYHDVNVALADGFISTFECVSVPGLGTMGVHYINPSRMSDLSVNERTPEMLLYIPQPDGSLRLVALEYYAPVLVADQNGVHPWFGGPNDPPPNVVNPAPTLFGRTFEGPMAGHAPGQPWHYDLHVWAWRNNPNGLFFDFNPKLTCPAQ